MEPSSLTGLTRTSIAPETHELIPDGASSPYESGSYRNLPPHLPLPLGKRKSRIGWRPTTLKLPSLIAFAVLTSILIVATTYLLDRSNRNGAIVFTSSSTSLVAFWWDYGPTIVAVLYGLIWATIDHDLKRLEPYFQLSSPAGATAENSLLLSYPYMLQVWVPFVSIRKKYVEAAV